MYGVNQSPTAYEAEVKRMRDTYGPDAEIPHLSGLNTVRVGGAGKPTTASVAQRIAEISKALTEAGYELEAARSACREANARRAQWESTFVNLSSELVTAIQEHREGTPEGVSYQP